MGGDCAETGAAESVPEQVTESPEQLMLTIGGLAETVVVASALRRSAPLEQLVLTAPFAETVEAVSALR